MLRSSVNPYLIGVSLVRDAASGMGRRHCNDTVDGKEKKQKEQQRLLFFYGELIPQC